ncbi:MAG: DUF2085 domain-containing protein [Anaerolineales bacterium]|nr:DUF2085 domain-containing protein [Anaerolineales bacterium]
MTEPSFHSKLAPPGFTKKGWLMLTVSALVIAVFLFSPPLTLLDKTQAIGYAVCHQIPARSFHLAGQPLPLCARCTGIYLGALLGIVGMILLRRYHSVEFPPPALLVTLLTFTGLMGIDGVNSYLSFFPKLPHLYEPQNWLRLTTGSLHGLTMSALVFPIMNGGFWHASRAKMEPVIKNFRELLLFLGGIMGIILIVLWEQPFLLYPLALLSTLGVLLMLSIVGSMFVLILTRQEGAARTWSDLILPGVMGLAIAILIIEAMGGIRAILIGATGLRL